MKRAIFLISIIVLILITVVWYFFPQSLSVSEIGPIELYEHSLKQKEVKSILGNQEIENYDVSPTQSLSKEKYDVIGGLKPSCLEEINLGDGVRIVTYHTPNRNIDIIYSTESNNLLCVTSENI